MMQASWKGRVANSKEQSMAKNGSNNIKNL